METLRRAALTLVFFLATCLDVTAKDLSPQEKIYQCTYLLYFENGTDPRGSAWIINTGNERKTVAITAAHCVSGLKKRGWKIRHPAWKPEEHIPVYVVGCDKERDVAILAQPREGGYPGLNLNLKQPRYAEMVTGIINGADYPHNTVRTRFYITRERTVISEIFEEEREYDIFLGKTIPGTSGSPIVNTKGEVIGIAIGKQDFQTEEAKYDVSLGTPAIYILYTLRDYGFKI